MAIDKQRFEDGGRAIDFLSDRLGSRMPMLLVEVGSTAHGTGLPGGEDFDVAAIFYETEEEVLGLGQNMKGAQMFRTAKEGKRSGPGDIDAQVYTLRHWAQLASKGNPSILQMMWSPIIFTAPGGMALRDRSGLFVGKHIVKPYRGYMQSQVQRLVGTRGAGHGRRGSGQREELVHAHGYDTKFAMHAARLGLQCRELLRTGRLEMPNLSADGDWLRAVRRGEIRFEDWWNVVLKLDAELPGLAEVSNREDGPAIGLIDEFLVQAHRNEWWR